VAVIEPVEIEPLPPPEPEPQIEEQHQPIAEPPATPVIEEQSEEITEEKINFTAKEENALALPLVPPAVELEKVFSLAVEPDAGSEEEAAPYPPTPAASETRPLIDAPVEIHGEEVIIHQGDRRYRARPWKRT